MSNHPYEWSSAVARIVALSQRLEGHGQYNLTKLIRAAADSLSRRAAYELGVPDDVAANAADLAALAGVLASLGVSSDVTERLSRGATAMADRRLPLYDEIPNPYVCRTCGDIQMAVPEQPCSVCGAWPTNYEQILPVYWLSELQPPQALAQLSETPRRVSALLDGLTEDEMSMPGPDGGWSIRQIVSHMRDAQGVLDFRVRRIAELDNPTLESLAVFEWVNRASEKPETAKEILQSYIQARGRTLEFLRELDGADWWRTGQHIEFGTVTLQQQASYFSMHEQTHLTVLAEFRRMLR